ncbi:hypothetical protein M426DRAFT_320919 [Hypoxylon sp. CI-4A]|nr:hypothetical protein M426DRAFT_320919 [Hypoxylon sp. CI-4A]
MVVPPPKATTASHHALALGACSAYTKERGVRSVNKQNNQRYRRSVSLFLHDLEWGSVV